MSQLPESALKVRMHGPMQVTKTTQTNAKRTHEYTQKITNVYVTILPPGERGKQCQGTNLSGSRHADLSGWFTQGH